MNSKLYKIFIGLVLATTFYSCEDDFEKVPLEQYTLDYVFSTSDSTGVEAKKYLNNVYSYLQSGHNRVGGDYLAAASDDAVSSNTNNPDVFQLATGAYNATLLVESDMQWNHYYEGIRRASQFISNIDVVPVQQTYNGMSLAKVWKSEARFIRAFHYFNLVKGYGGVPLMGDHVRQLGENVEIPRSTFAECIDYIIGELDAIQDSLRTFPVADPQSNSHVVTREAALALKSRVLLYAASPLFNGGNIDPSNPLTGYSDANNERWKAAADAAKMLISEGTFSLADNFKNVFITEGNSEVIFFRPEGPNSSVETDNGPVGFSGNSMAFGRTSPTQNLVNAFPLLDGRAIDDPESAYTYNPNNPYANRDPRLNFTVLHNNSQWLNTALETFEGGTNKPGGSAQQTRTSYYLRKFMGNFETANAYSETVHDWVLFRYAEILLNFAEAQNEYAGPTAEVYQVLKDLRERAGIEAGGDDMYGLEPNMTKIDMREIIHNERRIELAFEEQRYWDIRRWKEAEAIFAEPLNGLRIIKAGSVLNYNTVPVLTTSFEKRRYFYPIPYGEVIKNENMVQNPGW